MKKKYLVSYIVFIVLFTVYFIMDTFVITKKEIVIEQPKEKTTTKIIENIIVEDNYYKDDSIEIKLEEVYENKTHIYVADVQLVNPEENLKTALAKHTYGKNIKDKVSVMAKENNAILAINGDYHGVREKGFVVRNYQVYREKANGNAEALVIYADGDFEIIEEKKTKIKDLNNPKEILSFGPALLIDGKIEVGKNQEVAKARATNPRTAIGMIEKGHYLFVVSDGRTKKSRGLSLYQLAEFMKKYNVKVAYNLDGGGSSTMVFNGKLINEPTHTGTKIVERKVSDIVYIGY